MRHLPPVHEHDRLLPRAAIGDASDLSALDPGFPPVGEAAWRALVAKTLGDKPFESLTRTTVEGLPIAPRRGHERGRLRYDWLRWRRPDEIVERVRVIRCRPAGRSG
jgi:hypothetical protein